MAVSAYMETAIKQIESNWLYRRPQIIRAHTLLVQHLNKEQFAQFTDAGCFLVRAKSGNIYLIRPGLRPRRVKQIKLRDSRFLHFRSVCAYCIIVYASIPLDDIALAFKIMIESDEHNFLRVANEADDWISDHIFSFPRPDDSGTVL